MTDLLSCHGPTLGFLCIVASSFNIFLTVKNNKYRITLLRLEMCGLLVCGTGRQVVGRRQAVCCAKFMHG